MRVMELHAPVQVISRGNRSVVAAAAYRAGEKLVEERTGLEHDYTRKQGLEGETIMLPVNAPDYAHERSRLWNGVDMNEKHPRAQTAREMNVAFPFEFGAAQRKEAGFRIGEWIVARYGVAVDIAWHLPGNDGDQRNHHAHFLFTTRRWDENGEWAKKKDRVLDDLKQGPEEVGHLRGALAGILNDISARERLGVYIEHLSYERRGIDKEPTQHLGPKATQMERDGAKTIIGDKNRTIQGRNEQREAAETELKVINIEIAREKLKAARDDAERQKAAARMARVQAAMEGLTPFYRETQARRAAMLDELDRTHGAQEQQLRQNIAGLTNSLDNASFLTRLWRGITGRTRAEKEQLAEAQRQYEALSQKRQVAKEAFERERQARLDELIRQQAEEERQNQIEAQPEIGRDAWPRAVGDEARGGPQRAAQPARPRTQDTAAAAPSPAPPPQPQRSSDSRRDYFQRLGAKKKQERESGVPSAPASPSPPAPDISGSEAKPAAPNDRETQYLQRIRQQREKARERRDRGPTFER